MCSDLIFDLFHEDHWRFFFFPHHFPVRVSGFFFYATMSMRIILNCISLPETVSLLNFSSVFSFLLLFFPFKWPTMDLNLGPSMTAPLLYK